MYLRNLFSPDKILRDRPTEPRRSIAIDLLATPAIKELERCSLIKKLETESRKEQWARQKSQILNKFDED